MKLPHAANALVPRAKIVEYLLSETHDGGRHKSAFFRHFGCRPENCEDFVERLQRHVCNHEITREEPSPIGRRFVVEGIMEMPDGRTPFVRTIWFLRTDESTPRFVTA